VHRITHKDAAAVRPSVQLHECNVSERPIKKEANDKSTNNMKKAASSSPDVYFGVVALLVAFSWNAL
jgi:hypothetical protein